MNRDILIALGRRVKQIRLSFGISQRDFAKPVAFSSVPFFSQLDDKTIQDLPFGTLSSLKKVQVLRVIAQMKSYPIYMFHDIEKNAPLTVSIDLDPVMRKMVAQGSLILLFSEEEAALMDFETSSVYERHDTTGVWKDTLPSKD